MTNLQKIEKELEKLLKLQKQFRNAEFSELVKIAMKGDKK